MDDEKKRQEIEKEKIKDQNAAFEIFNSIDSNKNNKYNFKLNFTLYDKLINLKYLGLKKKK